MFDVYNDNYHSAITGLDEYRTNMLKNNMSRLAAVKANQVTTELDRARADAKGVERDAKTYSEAAKAITAKYNRYQVAEYNTTVHRTRVVKQWEQFQKEKHLYPNVEWLHTRSAHPRADHLEYVGRVWAMNDPFFVDNQPGCIWECKCSWKTCDTEPTDNSEIKTVPPSPGLEGNPYYTEEIVTDKHPYFNNTKTHVADLGPLYNPDDIAYIPQVDKHGAKFSIHYNALKEYNDINKPFIPFVIEAGYKDIKLLPVIDGDEHELRKRYYGKFASGEKCPDAIADGEYIEFKAVEAGKKMRRNMVDVVGDAVKKSEVVFLKIAGSMAENEMKQFSKTMLDKYKGLKRIVLIQGHKSSDYTR